ncbi:cupin domain-containing protein [Aurantivibrio plasticivorans]
MLTQLGDITIAEFLSDYWQKKPLLVRQAFPQYQSPVSPDELAGLSLEHALESRLIIEDTNTNTWQLEHGPLDENRFSSLPSSHWTLLVQGVDALDPEVNQLLNEFRFMPNWRLDDIMVSYASDQGSVGPHFDYYDVFLIQTYGRRTWKLGQWCDGDSELIDNCDLAILKNFEQTHEWVLEPGDMLYVPPRLAHWGIALGESMNFSVGFRAPKTSELLSHFCDYVLQNINDDSHYVDPQLAPTDKPGLIESGTLNGIKQMMMAAINNANIQQWFGEFATQPRYPIAADDSIDTFSADDEFIQVEGARYAYSESQDSALLFVNGETWTTSLGFAQQLCDAGAIKTLGLNDVDRDVLEDLQSKYLIQLSNV